MCFSLSVFVTALGHPFWFMFTFSLHALLRYIPIFVKLFCSKIPFSYVCKFLLHFPHRTPVRFFVFDTHDNADKVHHASCAARKKILPGGGRFDAEKRTQSPLQIKALQYHLRWWNPIKSRKTIIRQWIQLGYIRIIINLNTNKCCG